MNKQKGKDSIIDFHYLIGKTIIVKFIGGKEVKGELNGFDIIGNLVLVNTEEINKENPRKLGKVFARGPNITSILPFSSYNEIPNPYE